MAQNKNLGPSFISEEHLIRPSDLKDQLIARRALDFYPYKSGLFPASALPEDIGEVTGMGLAWLRDNCHIANSLWQNGDVEAAAKAGRAILDIFNEARPRIDRVAAGDLDPYNPQNRLPVRVNGDNLKPDQLPQVQNDSVGYSLWLISRLIEQGVLAAKEEDVVTIAQTTRYLRAIRYWEDTDSGHWEEGLKVNASSIGAVVAGLEASKNMFNTLGIQHSNLHIDELIDRGRQSLDQTLPYETITPAGKERRYDAALLFLVEPLNVVNSSQAKQIVQNISDKLIREYGIARYEGDTYWGPNFRQEYALGERATYAPGRLEERNLRTAEIANQKHEAQWTLFDPILSVYWGKQFMETGESHFRIMQLGHLNRSLQQLTTVNGDSQQLKLPEAYFLENGEWRPNDHIPLLWSQANLLLALSMLERSNPT